jgi:hypothetical protein
MKFQGIRTDQAFQGASFERRGDLSHNVMVGGALARSSARRALTEKALVLTMK